MGQTDNPCSHLRHRVLLPQKARHPAILSFPSYLTMFSLFTDPSCASATASQPKNPTAFSFARIGFFYAVISPMCFSVAPLFLPANKILLSGSILLSNLLKNVLFASKLLVIEKKKRVEVNICVKVFVRIWKQALSHFSQYLGPPLIDHMGRSF